MAVSHELSKSQDRASKIMADVEGQDDFVADTPSSDRSNGGCPTYPTVHCKSADMTMNYMDYVYDDCMYMFTEGQNDRMRSLFVTGGAKASFVGN